MLSTLRSKRYTRTLLLQRGLVRRHKHVDTGHTARQAHGGMYPDVTIIDSMPNTCPNSCALWTFTKDLVDAEANLASSE